MANRAVKGMSLCTGAGMTLDIAMGGILDARERFGG